MSLLNFDATKIQLWLLGAMDYVSSLPADARPYLEEQLDWDNEGVDRDLIEIADYMIYWEETLTTHLGLTTVEIHDIKDGRSLPLQR